jgi:glycosyltransferase 2 family protein
VVSWVIRLGVGMAFLAALFYFGFLDPRVLSRAFNHPLLLGFAALLIAGSIPLGALRWWLLLIAQQFSMSLYWSLRVTLLAQFFNTFMPGAYGGDVARLALAYHATKTGLSRLTLTIFVDRLSGFVGLILLGLLALPGLPLAARGQAFVLLVVASLIIAAGLVCGLLWGKHVAALVQRVPRVGGKIAHALREVIAAFGLYLSRWPVLCAALAISVFQFVLVLISLTVIGSAMAMGSLSLSGYMIAGVWSIVANAIPITPGGMGIGEIAFARMAALLETTPSGASYATVFLAMRMLTTLASAFGVIPYLPRRFELRRDVEVVQKASATNASDGSIERLDGK